MPADVFVAILLCLILVGVLSTDLIGRLCRNRSIVNEIVTVSSHPNINVACPRQGTYRFNFDSETERSLVVYVNGKRQQELKLSGDTSLNIIVA